MTITFTTFQNTDWRDKIDSEITRHLEFNTQLLSSQVHNIFAFHELQLVGGIVYQIYGDILWIESLWVDANFRRQGIGKKLIQEVENFGKEYPVKCLQANTYFSEARDLFAVSEFQEVAKIPGWKYGLTCYFMKKSI